jgi:hypothetical protein
MPLRVHENWMIDMVLQDAYEVAQAFLDSRIRPDHGPDVVICSCTEYPKAWVFGYNTRRFLEDMDLLASMVGNGPVVVPKSGEPPFLGASASPIEGQLGDL